VVTWLNGYGGGNWSPWASARVSVEQASTCGRAPSYYVEQLALQGVLDVIESAGAMRTELNIQVGSPPKSAREALQSSQETAGSKAVFQPSDPS
jgi:hypothetical protein